MFKIAVLVMCTTDITHIFILYDIVMQYHTSNSAAYPGYQYKCKCLFDFIQFNKQEVTILSYILDTMLPIL